MDAGSLRNLQGWYHLKQEYMEQTKWFDRKFDFSSTQSLFPSIMERLMGTPLRLREKLRHIPASLLTKRTGTSWTILEHTGHLSDLEPLWQGRLEDIIQGKRELRPTDLLNTKTTEAGHNEQPPGSLIETFDHLRQQTLQQLEAMDEVYIFRSALHPRLQTPMRTTDLFLFVAEHDDHHLAAITNLLKQFRQA